MTYELIRAIEPFTTSADRWNCEEGYKLTTDEREILFLISSDQSCCEDWGYFLTEDDTERFIGSYLHRVEVTDTNRSNRPVVRGWSNDRDAGDETKTGEELDLYHGDVMFVDIQTSQGTLQFVAYNAHNGYYGHEARVISRAIPSEVVVHSTCL